MVPDDEDYWFAPKRYGYGGGLPIAWQGWALIGGYAIVLLLAAALIFYSVVGYVMIVAALTIALLVIAARKTRGGFRWRWGGKK
jgi:hypothetical protein